MNRVKCGFLLIVSFWGCSFAACAADSHAVIGSSVIRSPRPMLTDEELKERREKVVFAYKPHHMAPQAAILNSLYQEGVFLPCALHPTILAYAVQLYTVELTDQGEQIDSVLEVEVPVRCKVKQDKEILQASGRDILEACGPYLQCDTLAWLEGEREWNDKQQLSPFSSGEDMRWALKRFCQSLYVVRQPIVLPEQAFCPLMVHWRNEEERLTLGNTLLSHEDWFWQACLALLKSNNKVIDEGNNLIVLCKLCRGVMCDPETDSFLSCNIIFFCSHPPSHGSDCQGRCTGRQLPCRLPRPIRIYLKSDLTPNDIRLSKP